MESEQNKRIKENIKEYKIKESQQNKQGLERNEI